MQTLLDTVKTWVAKDASGLRQGQHLLEFSDLIPVLMSIAIPQGMMIDFQSPKKKSKLGLGGVKTE